MLAAEGFDKIKRSHLIKCLVESFPNTGAMRDFSQDYSEDLLRDLAQNDSPREIARKMVDYCNAEGDLDILWNYLANEKPKLYTQYYRDYGDQFDYKNRLEQKREVLPPGDNLTKDTLQKVQVFNTRMAQISTYFTDLKGQLWITDGQQVKIFQVNSPEPVAVWLLPAVPFKCFLPQIWRDRFLCSDWDGSLFMLNGQAGGREQVLYQAKYDALPIHCLAVDQQGQLVAATWDGQILSWAADGQPLLANHPPTVPYLPTHLVPRLNQTIAVADQAGYLRLLNSSGQQNWSWRADGVIRQLWTHETGDEQAILLALINDRRMIEVRSGEQQPNVIELDSPVVDLSHRSGQTAQRWTVLALAGGVVDWLSWSPFRIFRSNRVKFDFEIRQILAVYDPQRPNALIALGLTTSGQLFRVNDREVELFPTPPIQRLILDPSARFMFWLLGERIEVYRNPAILPTACTVKLNSIEGALTVNVFNEIGVGLENVGLAPIYKIRARLQGEDRIQRSEWQQRIRLLPGELMNLRFSVKAIAAGPAVPVELMVELEDEAGPPVWSMNFTFNVESREK